MSLPASELVKKLNLQPHPEGGFYAEIFRDNSVHLSTSQLSPDYKVSTFIYFLLPSGTLSRLHRIPCAQTWNHYIGDPLTVVELNEKDGIAKFTCLGTDLGGNEVPEYTAPPNVWFGSFPTNDYTFSTNGVFQTAAAAAAPRDGERNYSLVGCTFATAFQYQDYELAKPSYLLPRFPHLEPLITALTFPE